MEAASKGVRSSSSKWRPMREGLVRNDGIGPPPPRQRRRRSPGRGGERTPRSGRLGGHGRSAGRAELRQTRVNITPSPTRLHRTTNREMGLGFGGGNLHAGGGGEGELGGDGAAVEVLERHRRHRLLLRHGGGGRRVRRRCPRRTSSASAARRCFALSTTRRTGLG